MTIFSTLYYLLNEKHVSFPIKMKYQFYLLLLVVSCESLCPDESIAQSGNTDTLERIVFSVHEGAADNQWDPWSWPKTDALFNGDFLYWGTTSSTGYGGIAEFNTVTKSFKTYDIKQSRIVDDHNNTCVRAIRDNKLVVGFATGHDQDAILHLRIAIIKQNTIEFYNAGDIEFPGVLSYCQIIEKAGKYYIFTRVRDCKWMYITTEDFMSYSTPKPFIESDLQYYIFMADITYESDMVRVAMYSNPEYIDDNIRLGYIDFKTGSVYDADATTEISKLGECFIASSNFSVVISNENNSYNQRLWDLARTTKSEVSIAFTRYKTYNDGEYYVYHNGTTAKVCGAGTAYWLPKVQNGVCFTNEEELVVAREDNGTDYIELWKRKGDTWGFDKCIYKDTRGDSGTNRQIKPIFNDCGYVIWLNGYHSLDDYYHFKAHAMVYDLNTTALYSGGN